MSDLPERLRRAAAQTMDDRAQLMTDAAAEIERLAADRKILLRSSAFAQERAAAAVEALKTAGLEPREPHPCP